MTYGICNLTAIAMRKEARHASEMVSQLLYNETYTVLDTTKEWLLIQTEDKPSAIQQDHESGIEDSGAYPYQGWIQAKQFCEISEEEFNAMKGKTPYLINKPVVNYNGLLLTILSILVLIGAIHLPAVIRRRRFLKEVSDCSTE